MKLLPKETHTWRCMSLIDKTKYYIDEINNAWVLMAKEMGDEGYYHRSYCGGFYWVTFKQLGI